MDSKHCEYAFISKRNLCVRCMDGPDVCPYKIISQFADNDHCDKPEIRQELIDMVKDE